MNHKCFLSFKIFSILCTILFWAQIQLNATVDNVDLRLKFKEDYYISSDELTTYSLSIYFNENDSLELRSLEESNLLNHDCKQFDLKIIDYKLRTNIYNEDFEKCIEKYLTINKHINVNIEVLSIFFLDSEKRQQWRSSRAYISSDIFMSFPNIKKIRLIGDSSKPLIYLKDSKCNPLEKLKVFTMDNIVFKQEFFPDYLNPPNGYSILDLNFSGYPSFYINPTLGEDACFTLRLHQAEYLNIVISKGKDMINNDIKIESVKVYCNNVENVSLIIDSKNNKLNINTLMFYQKDKYFKNINILTDYNLLKINTLFASTPIRKIKNVHALVKYELKENSSLHERAYSRCLFND